MITRFKLLVTAFVLGLATLSGIVGFVHADAPTVVLSQLSGSTVPLSFVLRDDTAGIGSSASDYAKFYDLTSSTVYISKITTAPYAQAFTLTAGTHKIQVRHVVNGGSEVRVDATFTVVDSATTPPTTPPTTSPTPPDPNPAPRTPTTTCIPTAPAVTAGGNRQVPVSTSAGLKAALADARAGDVITLADGVYESSTATGAYYASFGLTRSGTADAPIIVQGSANAKIRGNGIGGRYGFELYGTQYVMLKGFTVFEASKGIVLDGSSYNTIDGVTVSDMGAEGVHFRAMSSNNALKNSLVADTGLDKQNFGEGIYVGSAGDSNWTTYSCDLPDTSDNNRILQNTVLRARAESVDIKEGTTGTLVDGNTFIGDQSAAPAAPFGDNSADSWMDVKGNDSIITNNTGTNSLNHGFEVHAPVPAWYKKHPGVAVVAWGSRNVFSGNTANVNNAAATGNPLYTGGYGFSIVGGSANTVRCDNTVTGAVLGFSNIACTP